jgi:hypothetical protein
MVSQDTVPPELRASDEDREKAIEKLQHGSVDGRLSNDTFLQRVDLALRARRRGELAGLLRDLPSPAPRTGWLDRSVTWWAGVGARVQRAWRTPRMPMLILPRADRVFLIGRSPECDLALPNMTVSWRHAELRRMADEWILTDLGSTNGTRVNGWHAGSGFIVRPGDCVMFGNTRFLLAE